MSENPTQPNPCPRSHRSTFDKRLAAGFRRHLTLGKLSGDVKSKFTVQDGSRIIASCLVGLDGPGGHQNWAKLSTPNRTQQTQLFPLKKKEAYFPKSQTIRPWLANIHQGH
ncbi:hypothetical protein T06_7150 [Trichinella sp. T6]|nr:hypothetical protein T06_7150 [Trichinella sp. T6]